jgi:UDP-N-acetylmuramoyl-tripeptide--D-alanyl-D-alanine ligase
VIRMTTGEIARVLGGRVLGDAGLEVDGRVETDSRLVEPGAIFVAMRGEHDDGARFAPRAVEAGAALVIAERDLELDVPVVVVDSGVRALAALARHVVASVRSAGGLRVVGITGSNGKTTTKNLLRAILSAEGPTVAPQGSFNNHVGAPVSMLRIDRGTASLVVEMGASREGDIAHLVGIAMPDVAVVLKVGLAHAGEFGGIERTQRAKTEIVRGLPSDAVAVLNADDRRVMAMRDATGARIVTFGTSASADVRATDIDATRDGTTFTLHAGGGPVQVRLRILGEHHVMNALAAIAAARELGVAVPRAVAAVEGVDLAERWRMQVTRRADGVTIVNDAYNASPDSTAAALKTLAQISEGGRSVAVLGEMTELGELADEEHDRLGRLAVRLNVDRLVVVGHGARHIHNAAGLEGSWDGESLLVEDADAAYDVLRADLRSGDVVLVKSSNSAGLRFLGDRLGEVGA